MWRASTLENDILTQIPAAVARATLPASVLNLVSLPVLASTVARRGKSLFSFLGAGHLLTNAESHNKSECTKPRVFKGPCRICNEEGHPAAECPQRPPDICKNCKMEGMLS